MASSRNSRGFVLAYRACGELRGDADPATPEGYRPWASCSCAARLKLPLTLRGAGLNPGVVDEELFVELDELLRRLRGFVLGEDRLHRTHRLARSAVDALVGVYEELIRALVDTVDRADLDTGFVLDVDTRLGDDIRHGHSLSGSQVFSSRCRPPGTSRSRSGSHFSAGWYPAPPPTRNSTSCIGIPLQRKTPVLYHRNAAGAPIPLAEQEGEQHVPLPARH